MFVYKIRWIHFQSLFSLILLFLLLNTGTAKGATWLPSLLWENGSTLNIHFLNGSREDMEFVKDTASTWTQYANLHFKFHFRPPGKREKSDIRIILGDNKSNGGWSFIGSSALEIAHSKPTMQLPVASPILIKKAAIMHEFGHALGLVHEHSSPLRPFFWNRDEVISCYTQGGQSVENINYQRLKPYPLNVIKQTLFDYQSIMFYPIHGWEVQEPFAHHITTMISEVDKLAIAQAYPRKMGQNQRHNYTLDFSRGTIHDSSFFQIAPGLADLIDTIPDDDGTKALLLDRTSPRNNSSFRFRLPPGSLNQQLTCEFQSSNESQGSDPYLVVNDRISYSLSYKKTDTVNDPIKISFPDGFHEGLNTISLFNTTDIPHGIYSLSVEFDTLKTVAVDDKGDASKMGHILISQKAKGLIGNAWNYTFDVRKLPEIITKRFKEGYNIEGLDYNPRNGVYTILFTRKDSRVEQRVGYFDLTEAGNEQRKIFLDKMITQHMIKTSCQDSSLLPEPYPGVMVDIFSPRDSESRYDMWEKPFSTIAELQHFLQSGKDGQWRTTQIKYTPHVSTQWYVIMHRMQNDPRPWPRFFVAKTIDELLAQIERERKNDYFVSTLEYGESEGVWAVQFLHKNDLGAQSQRVTVVHDDDAWSYEFPLPAMQEIWAQYKGEYVTELVYGKVNR